MNSALEDPPLLSICIPTIGRPQQLAMLIESIHREVVIHPAAACIEVCISDNSSDGVTRAVVEQLQHKHAVVLSYKKTERFLEFGENLRAVTELARGEYILYTGDDDTMAERSISLIMEDIAPRVHAAVIYTSSWQKEFADNFPAAHKASFRNLDEFISIAGPFHMSFMGNIVVRRTAAVRALSGAGIRSCYAHCYTVAAALAGGPGKFVNARVFHIDETARDWRRWTYHFHGVDFARVQQDFFRDGQISRRTLGRIQRRLLRSLPYAIFTEKIHGLPARDPHFTFTNLRNLADIYGNTARGLLFAVVLAVVSRCVPRFACARILDRKRLPA